MVRLLLEAVRGDGLLSTEAKEFYEGLSEKENDIIELLKEGGRNEGEIISILGIEPEVVREFIRRAKELHLIYEIGGEGEGGLNAAAAVAINN